MEPPFIYFKDVRAREFRPLDGYVLPLRIEDSADWGSGGALALDVFRFAPAGSRDHWQVEA